MMLILIFLLIGLPGLTIFIEFLGYLFTGKRVINNIFFRIAEIVSLVILPFLYAGFGNTNKCCGDSMDTAVFSPEHQLTIGIIILLCLASYFYCSYRQRIASPIIEVLLNSFLLIGIVLNIFIAFHTEELWLAMAGNVPIILFEILMLAKNQQLFMNHLQQSEKTLTTYFDKLAYGVLSFSPLLKFPILLILCLPVLIILTTFLLLFGQKPDSIIRAFTDTYKHGLSKWDYKCDNVACGGHYLCSVAANGHKKIVHPKRLGIRNGSDIICNRQLLISNAFEELLQERLPFFHKKIRQRYDKVGDLVHRYYDIFNIKIVSDFIYILMKPLEWFFLLTLYLFDRSPENRIAKQYLSIQDRKLIEQQKCPD